VDDVEANLEIESRIAARREARRGAAGRGPGPQTRTEVTPKKTRKPPRRGR
jgi:hypothetical protein